MRRILAIVLAATGLVLFAYVLWRMDPVRVWAVVRRVTPPELAALFGLRLGYWLIRAQCWRLVLRRCGGRASLGHLLGARLAGHAVGYLTPSSRIGGEAFKVLMVDTVSRRTSAASAVVDKTIELQATVLSVAAGVFIAVTHIPMAPGRRRLLSGLALLVILLVFLLVRQQRRGLFSGLMRLLDRLGLSIGFLERNRSSMAEADSHMAAFYSRHRGTWLTVFGLYLFMILWWTLEVHLNLHFLSARGVTPADSFLLISLGAFAYLLPGLPGALGVYEVTYISLFALLGIPLSSGIAFILFRRVLGLAGSGAGLLVIWARRSALRRGRPRSHPDSGPACPERPDAPGS